MFKDGKWNGQFVREMRGEGFQFKIEGEFEEDLIKEGGIWGDFRDWKDVDIEVKEFFG